LDDCFFVNKNPNGGQYLNFVKVQITA
jgi:hypothetical protein